MDRLSPQVLLLQESKREQQFHLKPANEQFCDWLNFDQIDPYLREEKPCMNTPKRHVFSNNTNKISSPNYRRYISPCSNWTKDFKNFDIKFEHFTDSSYYIEQYRRGKQLRIEEKLRKLMQLKEKTVSCQKGSSMADRNLQSSELAAKQDSVYPKQGRVIPQPGVRSSGDAVKPSLPQTGYFAGRKWIYPKDFARVCSKNIGVNCGSSRTQLKRTEKQEHNMSTKMFLRGTGKPLNISCNKNFTVHRQRTVCKSAPTSRENQPKLSQSGTWNTTQVKPMKSPARSESLTCADLSVLLQKHSLNQQPKSSLQTMPVSHAYGHAKSPKKSVDSKNVGDRVEYEKIFRNVFDFYEQNSDSRSHVYINT